MHSDAVILLRNMGKRSRRRRTAEPSAVAVPVPPPPPVIQLRDGVQERCKGKVGLELARELVDAGLEQVGGTRKTIGSALRKHLCDEAEGHVKRMLKVSTRFPFPGIITEPSLVVPKQVLPLSVSYAVAQERFDKHGQWLVENLNFDTLGKECTRLMQSSIGAVQQAQSHI